MWGQGRPRRDKDTVLRRPCWEKGMREAENVSGETEVLGRGTDTRQEELRKSKSFRMDGAWESESRDRARKAGADGEQTP